MIWSKRGHTFIDYSIQSIWCSIVQNPNFEWPSCWLMKPHPQPTCRGNQVWEAGGLMKAQTLCRILATWECSQATTPKVGMPLNDSALKTHEGSPLREAGTQAQPYQKMDPAKCLKLPQTPNAVTKKWECPIHHEAKDPDPSRTDAPHWPCTKQTA